MRSSAPAAAHFFLMYFTSATAPRINTAITNTITTTPAKPDRLIPAIFMARSFHVGDGPIIQRGGRALSKGRHWRRDMSKREKCGRRYRKLVARQRSLGLPCWICGGGIRYDLPGGHPLSFEYDHYYPASRWQEFGYESQSACIHDPGNGRSAHRVCNERRQGTMPWEKSWKRLDAAQKSSPAPPEKRSRAE